MSWSAGRVHLCMCATFFWFKVPPAYARAYRVFLLPLVRLLLVLNMKQE